MSNELIEIHVELLEEGTPTLIAVKAEVVGKNIYKLIANEGYDPEDEIWEFLPDSYVKGEIRMNGKEAILVAVEQVSSMEK